ncbi:MAG: alanine racemase, partial [Clostridia bacterium]
KRPIIAVVKADAYGHGAAQLARIYEELGACMLAVATVSEADDLRASGISGDILIFGRTAPCDIRAGYVQAVFSLEYARELAEYAPKTRVHVKIDTGMGRVGVRTPDEVAEIAKMLPAEGVFTHLADADNENSAYTEQQIARFNDVILKSGVTFRIRHASASTGVLHFENARFDAVRPGLILYGLYPDARHESLALQPVMSLKTRVMDVRSICAGESVSYGRTYTAARDMRVAVLPIGYADGLPRSLSNSGEVLLHGTRVPIIGRICMDMCMVDVSACENVQCGDVCEVFGRGISADELAVKTGTISYEIVTGVSKRAVRVTI